MKIFVVIHSYQSVFQCEGVFLTKKEAKKYIKEENRKNGSSPEEFKVQQFALDNIDYFGELAKFYGVTKEYFINNINDFLN